MSAYVLFFGGYKATRTDINVWSASAAAQKSDATFDGYPWPAGASSDATSAISTFTAAGSYAQAIATIQECATDLIYLVGHSSGCAIANAVDRGLKDTSKSSWWRSMASPQPRATGAGEHASLGRRVRQSEVEEPQWPEEGGRRPAQDLQGDQLLPPVVAAFLGGQQRRQRQSGDNHRHRLRAMPGEPDVDDGLRRGARAAAARDQCASATIIPAAHRIGLPALKFVQ